MLLFKTPHPSLPWLHWAAKGIPLKPVSAITPLHTILPTPAQQNPKATMSHGPCTPASLPGLPAVVLTGPAGSCHKAFALPVASAWNVPLGGGVRKGGLGEGREASLCARATSLHPALGSYVTFSERHSWAT